MHIVSVTQLKGIGIEVVSQRSYLARNCLSILQQQNSTLQHLNLSERIELIEGDIMNNLHLLFNATHILMFDARFQSNTKQLLMHLFGHLRGKKLKQIFSCSRMTEANLNNKHRPQQQKLRLIQHAVFPVSTGPDQFTMFSYQVIYPPINMDLDLPVHIDRCSYDSTLLIIVATRTIPVDERILLVEGQWITSSRWNCRDQISKQKLLSHLFIYSSSDSKHSDYPRRLEILNLARFIRRIDAISYTRAANVKLILDPDTDNVYCYSTRRIYANDELLLDTHLDS